MSAASTSRATQYTVLNAALEKLQKNLETLEGQVEVTVVQSDWAQRLLTIHSSLFIAASTVLKEDEHVQEAEEDAS